MCRLDRGFSGGEVDPKLSDLLNQREDMKHVLQLLEEQLYKFEGELLSTSFYGGVLSGWDRSALSITPSRATPEMLNRKVNDDERIMSRSSVEFARKLRREAIDQQNRAHLKLSREDTTTSEGAPDAKRKRTSSPAMLSERGPGFC